MLSHVLNKSVAAIAASAVLLVSTAATCAEPKVYFRMGSGVTSSTTDPEETPDDKDATGGLTLTVPAASRARPGIPLAIIPGVEGAEGPVTVVLESGELPAGLGLSLEGAITGSPAGPARATGLRLYATDSAGKFGRSRNFALNVEPAPSITISPAARTVAAGDQVTVAPQVANAYGQTSYQLVGGEIPYGMALNSSTGRISGVPEQDASFAGLKLAVVDGDGAAGTSGDFSITVTSDFRVSGLSTILRPQVNVPFQSAQPTAIGATGTVAWTLADRILDAGLVLDEDTGVISGTPTEAGNYQIRIRATDRRSGKRVVSPPITVAVTTAPEINVATINWVRAGTAGYSVQPSVSGISGAPAWELISGSIPSGMTFDAPSGSITGVPTMQGTWAGITLKVTDPATGSSSQSRPITIRVGRKLDFPTPALPYARMGAPFSYTLPVVSGLYGAEQWDISGIPYGMSFNPQTRTISGTPTGPAPTSSLSFGLTDTFDRAQALLTTPFIVHDEDEATAFEVLGVSATAYGKSGSQFTTPAPQANGAQGSVNWSMASGALPSWAALDPATGVITGTPQAPIQVSGLALRATDASNGQTADSATFEIVIQAPAAVGLAMPAITTLTIGEALNITPTVTSASGALTFALESGSLPSWASLNPTTGAITGVSTTTGSFSRIVISATDAIGDMATSNDFSIRVNPADPPRISNLLEYYVGTIGTTFSTYPPQVDNVTGSLTWTLESGTLPSWAALEPAEGRIVGTPTGAGSWPGISMRMTDGNGVTAVSRTFEIEVAPPLTIAAAQSSFTAYFGNSFTTGAPIVTGQKSALIWYIAAGELQAGLTIDNDTGVISGTPTAPGATDLIMIAIESQTGRYAISASFNLTVPQSG